MGLPSRTPPSRRFPRRLILYVSPSLQPGNGEVNNPKSEGPSISQTSGTPTFFPWVTKWLGTSKFVSPVEGRRSRVTAIQEVADQLRSIISPVGASLLERPLDAEDFHISRPSSVCFLLDEDVPLLDLAQWQVFLVPLWRTLLISPPSRALTSAIFPSWFLSFSYYSSGQW